ncbi:MAG: monooxygenase [Porticoccaceae bacterium]|nr:MAG: monooxygenase [Porticoccaceae bacterium]
MNCPVTNVPPAHEIDIPALREKYRAERERRLRPDGEAQYAPPDDSLVHDTFEHDPFSPVVPRDARHDEVEVAILGAGWTGVLAAYHLKRVGVEDFLILDNGGDFGGTWYWNRYPGVQCDNDAYCYLPLLEETGFMPSQKFADGLEIFRYFQLIGRQFGLYDKALFHTLLTGLEWDEAIRRWKVTTNRGDELRARFVIMAGGTLSRPKFPNIPGLHTFRGKMFHTSRWDYHYTGGSWENPVLDRLADKRVAILGTGATAIQAVPFLGRYAKQLYVLQRTPSSVDERFNPPTDPEWVKTLKPGWQRARRENYHRGANLRLLRGEPDLGCDIWTEINRNLQAELEAEGWPELTPEEYARRFEIMDYRVMERLRRRVEAVVKDKATAEILKPWYRFRCKRPLSNNEFYETFNRPNVKLIDVSHTLGLERMTERGFVQDGVEYEVDCMIFASGFEVTSSLRRRWGIPRFVGRRGVSIYDHWADGPLTLHGIMTRHFPNMFFTGYIQGGLNTTTTLQFEEQVRHAAYIIGETLRRGGVVVEPTQEAQDAYVRHFREVEVDMTEFNETCPPSYFTNEGEKNAKWALFRGYGPGWDAFVELLERWRSDGRMEGLEVEGQAA